VDHSELLSTAGSLRQGTLRLARRLRLERGDGGITQQQFSLLAHVRRDGPSTSSDIATAERIQPQSLTRTIASLERAGLITREPHPVDRRSALLTITDAGREVLRADIRARDVWLAGVMAAHLTAAEQGLLRLAGDLMVGLAATDGGGTPQ
jgi:DNA-binding MarR family transcriptional regulator